MEIKVAGNGIRANLDAKFGIKTGSQGQSNNFLKHLGEDKNDSKANGFK
jgi:hypothetical protein